MTPEQHWGSLAIGSSGQTEVQVDQNCGDGSLLSMEITTPTWSCRFLIRENKIVKTMASFLQLGAEDSIVIGDFDGLPVELRRAPQFPDRFFIFVGEGGCACTEFIIAGRQEVSDLSNALLQAAEDLR